MNEEQLALVEQGLDLLIKKFKKNLNDGDDKKLQAAVEAKAAIRKVILNSAIKGSPKEIIPVKCKQKGYGWEVVEKTDRIVRFHAA